MLCEPAAAIVLYCYIGVAFTGCAFPCAVQCVSRLAALLALSVLDAVLSCIAVHLFLGTNSMLL